MQGGARALAAWLTELDARSKGEVQIAARRGVDERALEVVVAIAAGSPIADAVAR